MMGQKLEWFVAGRAYALRLIYYESPQLRMLIALCARQRGWPQRKEARSPSGDPRAQTDDGLLEGS